MSNVSINGRVSKDLEFKSGAGKKYALFSLAENVYKKVDSGYDNVAVFYSCIVFGDVLEKMEKAKVKKGSAISIQGRLDVSTYNSKSGETKVNIGVNVTDWSYLPMSKKVDGETEDDGDKTIKKDDTETEQIKDDSDLPF